MESPFANLNIQLQNGNLIKTILQLDAPWDEDIMPLQLSYDVIQQIILAHVINCVKDSKAIHDT